MPSHFDPEAIRFVSTSLQELLNPSPVQSDIDRHSYSSPQRPYEPSERTSVACAVVGAIREARLDTGDDNVMAGVIAAALQIGEASAAHRTNPQLFGR